MAHTTVAMYFAERDDKPHSRGKATVRRRCKKSVGPYTIECASSCGTRGPMQRPQDAGFVALRLYDRLAADSENPDGFVNEKKFQAENWDEAEVEMGRLIRLLTPPRKPGL